MSSGSKEEKRKGRKTSLRKITSKGGVVTVGEGCHREKEGRGGGVQGRGEWLPISRDEEATPVGLKKEVKKKKGGRLEERRVGKRFLVYRGLVIKCCSAFGKKKPLEEGGGKQPQ